MRLIFLSCLGVSETPHPHKIKAFISKTTWRNEEIVWLNKKIHGLPVPHIHQLGKMFRYKKEIPNNLLENQGNKHPVCHMEN